MVRAIRDTAQRKRNAGSARERRLPAGWLLIPATRTRQQDAGAPGGGRYIPRVRQPTITSSFPVLLGFIALAPLIAFAHGDVHERIAAVNERIAQDTNNATLYIQRGELHREHQDWPAATADYDRAAQLDLKLSRVDFYRARLFADTVEIHAGQLQV